MDPLTKLIISSGTDMEAPLPASIKIVRKPSISPAMAVHAAISFLSLGIGNELLMYDTDVGLPLSINIYPVGIVSSPLSFMYGADNTCIPISISGFLPDISDKNNMASAFRLI